MKNDFIWRMFCETGDPVCYLFYRSAVKETEKKPHFPPQNAIAFSGLGEQPEIRF